MQANNAPTVTVETITPAMAAHMLETLQHDHNRPIGKKTVSLYARQMKANQWILSNDAVAVNGKRLLNGQHRLAAVVESQTPCTFVVMRNAPSEMFEVADSGKKRGLNDLLRMEKYRYPVTLGTISRLYSSWLRSGKKLAPRNSMGVPYHNKPTAKEILNVIRAQPQLERSNAFMVPFAKDLRRHKISPGVLGFVHSVFALHGFQEEIERFVERLARGVLLEDFSPAYHIRRRFEKWMQKPTMPQQAEILATLVHAANYSVHGRPMVKLIAFRTKWPQFDLDGRTTRKSQKASKEAMERRARS